MTITTRLNDVDLTTVADLVGNIRTDPEHAKAPVVGRGSPVRCAYAACVMCA